MFLCYCLLALVIKEKRAWRKPLAPFWQGSPILQGQSLILESNITVEQLLKSRLSSHGRATTKCMAMSQHHPDDALARTSNKRNHTKFMRGVIYSVNSEHNTP